MMRIKGAFQKPAIETRRPTTTDKDQLPLRPLPGSHPMHNRESVREATKTTKITTNRTTLEPIRVARSKDLHSNVTLLTTDNLLSVRDRQMWSSLHSTSLSFRRSSKVLTDRSISTTSQDSQPRHNSVCMNSTVSNESRESMLSIKRCRLNTREDTT